MAVAWRAGNLHLVKSYAAMAYSARYAIAAAALLASRRRDPIDVSGLDDEYNTMGLWSRGGCQWPGAGGAAANKPPLAGGVTFSTPPPKVGLCLTL